MPNRNVEGMLKVALTSRHAPDSDKLRTVHASFAFFPRIIVPDLSVRFRGGFRSLAISLRPMQGAHKQRHIPLPLLGKACSFSFDCSGSRQTWFAASRGPSDAAWS